QYDPRAAQRLLQRARLLLGGGRGSGTGRRFEIAIEESEYVVFPKLDALRGEYLMARARCGVAVFRNNRGIYHPALRDAAPLVHLGEAGDRRGGGVVFGD